MKITGLQLQTTHSFENKHRDKMNKLVRVRFKFIGFKVSSGVFKSVCRVIPFIYIFGYNRVITFPYI